MSNGLLHGYKGIEYVIRAMPQILKEVPDAVYLIHGTCVQLISYVFFFTFRYLGRPHPNGVNTVEYYEMLLEEVLQMISHT